MQLMAQIQDTDLFRDIVQLLRELAERDYKIGERIAEIMNKHDLRFEYKSNKPYWYEIGQPVMFKLHDIWHKAKIINGYRTHDGIVNVELENGTKAWCGDSDSVRNDCLREIGSELEHEAKL